MMNRMDQGNDIIQAVYRSCAWLVCVLSEESFVWKGGMTYV